MPISQGQRYVPPALRGAGEVDPSANGGYAPQQGAAPAGGVFGFGEQQGGGGYGGRGGGGQQGFGNSRWSGGVYSHNNLLTFLCVCVTLIHV